MSATGAIPEKAAVAIALAHAASKGVEVARLKPSARLDGERWLVELKPRRFLKPRPGEFYTILMDADGGGVSLIAGK